jgi:hypothetical protein
MAAIADPARQAGLPRLRFPPPNLDMQRYSAIVGVYWRKCGFCLIGHTLGSKGMADGARTRDHWHHKQDVRDMTSAIAKLGQKREQRPLLR